MDKPLPINIVNLIHKVNEWSDSIYVLDEKMKRILESRKNLCRVRRKANKSIQRYFNSVKIKEEEHGQDITTCN